MIVLGCQHINVFRSTSLFLSNRPDAFGWQPSWSHHRWRPAGQRWAERASWVGRFRPSGGRSWGRALRWGLWPVGPWRWFPSRRQGFRCCYWNSHVGKWTEASCVYQSFYLAKVDISLNYGHVDENHGQQGLKNEAKAEDTVQVVATKKPSWKMDRGVLGGPCFFWQM